MTTHIEGRKRWWALGILCLGQLMIVLDTTIVNVALPSIRDSLHFSESSLAWVVNAYLLTFGGFLLLAGRLSDLYGHRKIFTIGVGVFTLASLACGLAYSQTFLITARALQGLAGAIVEAVSLSLTMDLFVEPGERAKAMGVIGFVGAGGGSLGVLLGGLLTGALNWHWIFLVNVPIGVLVVILSFILLPSARLIQSDTKHLDLGGALTVTSSLMLAVYAVVNGNQIGWKTPQTVGMLSLAIVLLGAFILIESKVKKPLMPLGLFKLRNIAVSNIVAVFWAAAMFAWFFMSALYLQLILGFTPEKVGLAFLPANLIMAVFSLGLSARLVMKFGIRKPLVFGLILAAAGLGLLALAPVDGNYMINVLPSMILSGIGAGIAFNPMLLAAMNDAKPSESGLASGFVNTSFMMGGALGLAALASIASFQTTKALTAGQSQIVALSHGYHSAFLVGGLCALLAAMLGGILLRPSNSSNSSPAMH